LACEDVAETKKEKERRYRQATIKLSRHLSYPAAECCNLSGSWMPIEGDKISADVAYRTQ
jgi:hypothetical protein